MWSWCACVMTTSEISSGAIPALRRAFSGPQKFLSVRPGSVSHPASTSIRLFPNVIRKSKSEIVRFLFASPPRNNIFSGKSVSPNFIAFNVTVSTNPPPKFYFLPKISPFNCPKQCPALCFNSFRNRPWWNRTKIRIRTFLSSLSHAESLGLPAEYGKNALYILNEKRV